MSDILPGELHPVTKLPTVIDEAYLSKLTPLQLQTLQFRVKQGLKKGVVRVDNTPEEIPPWKQPPNKVSVAVAFALGGMRRGRS